MSGYYEYLDWQALTADLFALLASHPDGLDRDEIAIELCLSVPQVHTLVHKARRILGDTDSVNVVCDPVGPRWLYRLVGTLDDAQQWTSIKLRDARTRLVTQLAIWTSLLRGVDVRTLEGRVIKATVLSLRHLIENIDNELGA